MVATCRLVERRLLAGHGRLTATECNDCLRASDMRQVRPSYFLPLVLRVIICALVLSDGELLQLGTSATRLVLHLYWAGHIKLHTCSRSSCSPYWSLHRNLAGNNNCSPPALA